MYFLRFVSPFQQGLASWCIIAVTFLLSSIYFIHVVFKAYLKMKNDKNDFHKDWIKIAWPQPAGNDEL